MLKSWKNLENNALSSLHKLHVTEPADPGAINAKTTLHSYPEPEFVNLLRSPGIDSRAGMITLFNLPARQATQAGGIDSLE